MNHKIARHFSYQAVSKAVMYRYTRLDTRLQVILSLLLVYYLHHGLVSKKTLTYDSPPSPVPEKISQSQASRLKNLNQNCQKYYEPYKAKVCSTSTFKNTLNPIATDCKNKTRTWWSYDWLADPAKNLAICMPPKAGCTTWQRFYLAVENLDEKFLNGSGKKEDNDIFELTPRLPKLGKSGQYRFLKGELNSSKEPVFKVLHSRHPFERLYSGWRDKFINEKGLFMKKYGKQILVKDGDWEDEKTTEKKPGVPFISFLRYINSTEMSKINNHFKPISYFCSPCEVNFNYISDMSTLTH